MNPAELLPHGGAMMLLDRVISWNAGSAICAVVSHLDPANPLRREGMLPAVCGTEFVLQAAAAHGGLRGGDVRRGYVAVLRDVVWMVDRLDDPALGELRAEARLVGEETGGVIYDLKLSAETGGALLTGRAVIAWPTAP